VWAKLEEKSPEWLKEYVSATACTRK